MVEKSSPFRLSYLLLKCAGFWPPDSGLSRRIYGLYTVAAVLAQLWITTGEIGAIVRSWGDLDSVTLLLGLLSGAIGGTTKTLIFIPRFRKFRKLMCDMQLLMEEQAKSDNREVRALLRKSKSYAWWLCATFVSLIQLLTLLWEVVPIVHKYATDSYEQLLPISVWYPYDAITFHGYKTTFACQVFALHVLCFAIVSTDALFFTFIIYATFQLKILTVNLTGLRSNSTAELRHCVRHHRDIIRFVEGTESVMNDILLPQFLVDLLMICLTLFQSLETNNIRFVMTNFAMLLGLVFHLFLYCWHAQQLTEQSEKVSNAAYNANWIDASPRFRKSLLIMMIGGRKPLGLTCGKFSVISGGTFLGIINAAYSYYAILSQINRHAGK